MIAYAWQVTCGFLRLSVVCLVWIFCAIDDVGAEDATPQLIRAVAGLPPDASVLDLPQGTYTIGSTWVITRPGITIRGAGIGKTILMRSGGFTGQLVNISGAGSTITGLTIDGNCSEQTQKISAELALSRPHGTAEMIEVRNFCHIGIAVPSTECRVTHCVITGTGNPAVPSVGVWHDAGKDPTNSVITIDHNLVRNNGINGIYCTGGKIIIANNKLLGNHCQTIPNGGGQIDVGSVRTNNTEAVITDNIVADGGGARTGGLELGSGRFYVARNTVRNHALGGIGLDRKCTGIVIDNVVSNSGQNTAHPIRDGIVVGPGATDFKIISNRVFDDRPTKTQTWGIHIKPGCDQYEVRDNDLHANVNAKGLLDESKARNRIVVGNLPSESNH